MQTNITKPHLIYDGDCDFCIFWVNRWKHITKDRIVYVSYQTVSHQFSDIPTSEFQISVQYILEDGQRFSGAEAVLRALDNRMLIWCYNKLPGFDPLTESLYRFVTQHRKFFSKITRRFFEPDTD